MDLDQSADAVLVRETCPVNSVQVFVPETLGRASPDVFDAMCYPSPGEAAGAVGSHAGFEPHRLREALNGFPVGGTAIGTLRDWIDRQWILRDS